MNDQPMCIVHKANGGKRLFVGEYKERDCGCGGAYHGTCGDLYYAETVGVDIDPDGNIVNES